MTLAPLHTLPLFRSEASIAPSAPILEPDRISRLEVELEGRSMTFEGRQAFALAKLYNAGKRGLTTIELSPGLRWSDYVFKLRKAGIGISAENEGHGGVFAGRHARYTLQSAARILKAE